MAAAFTIPSIFTAIDRFSAPMAAMGTAVDRFVGRAEAGMNRADRAFRKLITPLTSINRMLAGMGLYVGLFSVFLILKGAIGIMADFQQAQQNISAVTGVAVEKNRALSNQARQLALDYGVAATKVSELQYELIKLGGIDVLKTTEAALVGATGLQIDPTQMGTAIGAISKAYKGLVDAQGKALAGNPQQIVDQMVKISDITAIGGSDLLTLISNSASAAAAAKIPFTTLLALFGAAKDRMLQTASASTALKNIFIDNAVAGKELYAQLERISKSPNELKKAFQLYNKKSAQTGLVGATALASGELQKNIDLLMNADTTGYAQKRAVMQLETYKGTLKQTRTAYQEMILSIDDGTGAFAKSLTTLNKVVGSMFLILSGSDNANAALKKMDANVVSMAHTWLTWVKVIGVALGLLLAMNIALKLWAAAIIIAKVALFAYNVAWGIYNAITKVAIVYTATQTAAMYAQVIATNIITAAQWAWNAAMLANPIGLIIVALAAMIGYVYVATKHWDEFGASMSLFVGVIGPTLIAIMTIRRHWNDIVQSFSSGGMIEGIRAIGRALVDMILQPMQQLAFIIHKLTGAEWAKTSLAAFTALRQSMNMDFDTDHTMTGGTGPQQIGKPVISPIAARMSAERDSSNQSTQPTQFGKLLIELMNNSGTGIRTQMDSTNVQPVISSSMGY